MSSDPLLDRLRSLPPPLSPLEPFEDRLDYPSLGIGPEHTADLIRIACDWSLNTAPSEICDVWTPVHAWRALGELRVVEAVEPLLRLGEQLEHVDDYWFFEDVPAIFADMGPPAMPILTAYLERASREATSLVRAVILAITCLGDEHPEEREASITALMSRLKRGRNNSPDLNGLLVSALLELQVEKAAPLIQQMYEEGSIDETFCGSLTDVLWELDSSLESPPLSALPEALIESMLARKLTEIVFDAPEPAPQPRNDRLKSSAKAKRKAQRKARKKNARRR